MTDDRTLERAARSWIEEGPMQAPDRAVERALLRIATTPQERDPRIPWRVHAMTSPARIAAAAVIGVLVVGGAVSLLTRPIAAPGGPGPSASPSPSLPPSETPATPSARDYSTLPGRILAEHLGNAIDESEMPTTEYNPDTRRFYFLDPADMTGATAEEFLPGQPSTGKFAADVSADGRKVVFQDWAERPKLYEANLDGSGFRLLPIDCDCQLLYPDFDPTATKIAYARIEGDQSWLEIFDLGSQAITPLQSTRGPAVDLVPEQPAWSPDGTEIAFSRLSWTGNEPVVGTVRYGNRPPTEGRIEIVTVVSGAVREVPLPAGTMPGDVNWFPDGNALLYSHAPASTTGSTGNMPAGRARRVNTDGTGHAAMPGWSGPKFLPDGSLILVQDNIFYLSRPDGSNLRPVNDAATDLSDLAQGFVYIGHWVPAP